VIDAAGPLRTGCVMKRNASSHITPSMVPAKGKRHQKRPEKTRFPLIVLTARIPR
jgi:hypothetical protein